MENVKHTAVLEILAISPAKNFDGTPAVTKEGKSLFECAYKAVETKKIAGQEFKNDVVEKIKSEVELKPGKQTVALAMYPMSETNSKKVEVHYRIISIEKAAEK